MIDAAESAALRHSPQWEDISFGKRVTDGLAGARTIGAQHISRDLLNYHHHHVVDALERHHAAKIDDVSHYWASATDEDPWTVLISLAPS